MPPQGFAPWHHPQQLQQAQQQQQQQAAQGSPMIERVRRTPRQHLPSPQTISWPPSREKKRKENPHTTTTNTTTTTTTSPCPRKRSPSTLLPSLSKSAISAKKGRWGGLRRTAQLTVVHAAEHRRLQGVEGLDGSRGGRLMAIHMSAPKAVCPAMVIDRFQQSHGQRWQLHCAVWQLHSRSHVGNIKPTTSHRHTPHPQHILA